MISSSSKLSLFFKVLMLSLAFFNHIEGSAQSVFWVDSFDFLPGGGVNDNAGQNWTLNSNGFGDNQWYINTPTNMGCGSNASLHVSCGSFPCTILGGPNAVIYNASSASDRTAESPDISTEGQTNITLNMTWTGIGELDDDYCILRFSNDGGISWTDMPNLFQTNSECVTTSVAVPAEFEETPNFRIGFKWINSNNGIGSDLSFHVDNIQLSVLSKGCIPPIVNAGSNLSICSGEQIVLGGSPTSEGGSETGDFVYVWSPSTNLDNPNIANPTANITESITYTITVHRGTPSCATTSSVSISLIESNILSVTSNGPLVICDGQSVELTGSPGFIDYLWTLPDGSMLSGQTINATQIGLYNLSAVAPNNCLVNAEPTLVQAGNSPLINVTADGPLTFCNGQDVTLTAGSGFTDYVWSNGFTGSSITVFLSGTYSVTATSGTCDAVSNDIVVTVTNSSPIIVSPSGPFLLCPGEPVTLSASEGYSNYIWSNNQVGQTMETDFQGFYSVTGEDSEGCFVSSNIVQVSYFAVTSIEVTPSGTVAVCDGSVVNLIAESGYSNYVWSNSVLGQQLTLTNSGVFAVSAEDDNGCTNSSDAVVVNFINNETASFTFVQTDIPIYTVEFTSTEVADEYLWDFGQGQTSTEPNPSHTFPFDGTYPVTLTITNSCGSTSITLDVEVIKTSINDFETLSELNFYKTIDGSLLLSGYSKFPQEIYMELLSISGQLVFSKNLNVDGQFSTQHSMEGLAKGMYLLRIVNNENSITGKFIR